MLNVVLIVLSIALYYFSPMGLSMPIILSDLAVFLVGVASLMRNKNARDNIMSFNYLFLLSFFLCTYAFSIFVLSVGVEFSMSVFALIDFNYVTKAVSLSTLAISIYFCSYSHNKIRVQTCSLQSFVVPVKKLDIVKTIRMLLFWCTFANALLFAKSNRGSAAITSAMVIPELYKIFLILSIVLSNRNGAGYVNGIMRFLKDNMLAIIEAIVLSILYLLIGDRGLPISVVLTILCAYSFLYKKISLSQFAILAMAGVFVLYAIRVTRASDDSLSSAGISAVARSTKDALSGKSMILVFSDLMGANCELCLGYEYVERYGLQYPLKLLLIPMQPIPKLPSIMGHLLYGKVPYELSLGYILNEYVSTPGYSGSFGNHIVADVYIHWGILGLVFFFWLFGRVISTIEIKKYSSLYGMCALLLIVSYSLYLPRDSMFTLMRPLVFLWFFIKVLGLVPDNCQKSYSKS